LAKGKKGQLFQFLTVMVDATDFASVESGITESDFNSGVTKKFYGLNVGGSAATTSGTISKTASLVRSGVFRIILKGTETNYDRVMVRINKTGCAEQIHDFEFVDNDDSDIMSALTVIQSMASDAASAAQQGNSRVLVVQSMASDIRSHVSDLQSDFQSRVPKAVATNSQLSDLHSDLRSFLVVMSGIQSDLYSQVSDFRSDLNSFLTTTGVQLNASTLSDLRSAISAGPAGVLTVSDISDIASRVDTVLASRLSDILSAATQINSRVLVVQSMASDAASAAQQANSRILVNTSLCSDIFSQLSDFRSDLNSFLTTTGVQLNASSLSDLRSAIAGVTATVSASDISDIASAVRAAVVSDLSDILSAAQQANSRVLATQSMASDAASAAQSARSLILLGVGLTISAMSDVASQVWAHATGARADSRLLVVQSMASDIRSHVSDLQSDFQSRVPKLVATNSQLSDLASDLKSAIGNVSVALTASDISDIASAVAAAVTTVTASDISDIASRVDAVLASRLSDILSAAQQANSRVLTVVSQASDIYSLLSDVQSDFQSRVPKRVATDSQLSALASDVISALAAGVPVSASDMSDLRSAIAAGTLTASAISDIASAVAQQIASDLSDTLSGVRQVNSRLLVAQSTQSDIYSLLSDLHSDVGVLSGVVSDLDSAVDAGVELGPSTLSDLRSAITANGVLTAGAEPTGVPGHAATRAEKIDWNHAMARNKVKTTSTLMSLRDDADANTLASATVADSGGSFVRGEWSS